MRSELSLGGVFSIEQEMWYFPKTMCHRRIDIDNCGPEVEYEIVITKFRLYSLKRVRPSRQCGVLSLEGQNVGFHVTHMVYIGYKNLSCP